MPFHTFFGLDYERGEEERTKRKNKNEIGPNVQFSLFLLTSKFMKIAFKCIVVYLPDFNP